VFSGLPNNKYYKVEVKSLNPDPIRLTTSPCGIKWEEPVTFSSRLNSCPNLCELCNCSNSH